MSRLIDADALIEFCAERWIPLNIDAVNMQPTIQPEKAQLSQEGTTKGTTSDLISRQAAINALDKQIKQCCKALGSLSLSDIDKHAVEVRIASLRAYRKMLDNLPTVQPELSIPLSWIEKYIEWLKGLDNEFAKLAAAHISVMVKKWRGEQHE